MNFPILRSAFMTIPALTGNLYQSADIPHSAAAPYLSAHGRKLQTARRPGGNALNAYQ